MVLEAEDFIKRNIRYMGLRTDKFQRIDKYEYPIKALKEAIINGLIHRDYQSRADVRVFIFDDRVEIVSPGSFPEGVTPEKPIHKPVNSILSNYMYDIGLIERYGSGIYLENELCRINGNEKPIYDLGEIETKVIFKSQVRTISMDGVGEKYGLNKRQAKAAEYIDRIGTITNKEYRQLFPGINKKTVFRDLKSLVERGILIQKGEKKGRYYQLIGHDVGHKEDTVKGN